MASMRALLPEDLEKHVQMDASRLTAHTLRISLYFVRRAA